MKKRKKEAKPFDDKFGFASFILGLFSILFIFMVLPSLIMGIVAIIFAIIQLKKGKSKFAVAGLVLSIISLLVVIYLVVKIIFFIQGAYLCQTDISSEGCNSFAKAIGLDTEVMKCSLDPNAEGCNTFLETNGVLS